MQRGPSAIREVTPAEALDLMARGARLVDVREASELLAGTARGSVHLASCELAARINEIAPDTAATLLLICASGVRSLRAAAQLAALGYADVRSVAGGFVRWRREELPV